ncbi:hypothetical protein MMC13_007510 [Lambiella insularis]|nr:hypothetical protein [Lambiella insularis]
METPQEDVRGLTRQTPWLLATNRKLRHVQGVSLRNISFEEAKGRTRNETVDDASLPSTSNTPSRVLALRELRGHFKSMTDIQTIPSLNEDTNAAARPGQSVPTLRRRSTHNWSNTTPDIRQKSLEDVVATRLPETFVSIHSVGVGFPIYITETSRKTMNPDFAFFDLQYRESFITRLDEVVVNVWSKKAKMEEFAHLIQVQVHLSSLSWLGKTLRDFDYPLPKNTIILHLVDGIYACSTDSSARPSQLPLPFTPTSPTIPHVDNTSSLDSLMRLKNLDDCLQDAVATHSQMVDGIQEHLEAHKAMRSHIDQVSSSREHMRKIHAAVDTATHETDLMKQEKARIESTLKIRGKMKHQDLIVRQTAFHHLGECTDDIDRERKILQLTKTELRGQLRRLAEDISAAYSIEEVEDIPLGFTIHSLYLPNAEMLVSHAGNDHSVEETIAAALGHVALALCLLAHYLNFAMPYPIGPRASTSSISDHITGNLEKRLFPLYQTGVPRADFEYGVFLLNQNLVALMEAHKVRVVDPRTTLANLKNFLVVLASGPGEVPKRMTGRGRVNKAVGTGDPSTGGASTRAAHSTATVPNGKPNGKGKGKAKEDNDSVFESTGPFT